MVKVREPVLTIGGTVIARGAPQKGDVVLSDPADREPDELISAPDEEKSSTTRRVLRPATIPKHDHDPAALVQAILMHQRRGITSAANKEDWRDAEHFSLPRLKAGEQVKIPLRFRETKRLYMALTRLYIKAGSYDAIMAEMGLTTLAGVPRGKQREVLEWLLKEDEDLVVDYLDELRPNLVETVALKRQQQRRKAALKQFSAHFKRLDWDENEWQQFFEENTWIFGHNLLFRFLRKVENQANLGGTTLHGTGGQRTDMLMATEADAARFTVIVDIKRPDSELVGKKPYRNRVYPLGEHLTGGVSQLQSYCRMWEVEGSAQRDNVEELLAKRVYTYGPRGILVVGNLETLDNSDKRATFELIRQNLHNPEVITYDELFARAKHTVSVEAS